MLDDTGQGHQSRSHVSRTRGQEAVHVYSARGQEAVHVYCARGAEASCVDWPRGDWAVDTSHELGRVIQDGTQLSDNNPEIN